MANKTIIFVNDNGGADMSFGATTLTLGTNTIVEGFGNSATVTVTGGVLPINVIGDNFHTSGGPSPMRGWCGETLTGEFRGRTCSR